MNRSEMSVRERMLAVYHGQSVDRPALGIYQRYLPRGAKEVEARQEGMGLICYHPSVTMMAPPWHFYEGFLSEVKNTELKVEYVWKNGVRWERRSYHTPVGTLYQESCLDAGGVGSEHISKHYIADIEDYKIMSYLVENTIFVSNKNYLAHSMEDLGDAGVMLARLDRSPYQKCLIELAGPEQFLVDLLSEPEEVEPLLELMNDKMMESLELSLDTPADVFWLPDNVTSDMTPPNYFEKYCLPIYQKQTELASQTGKPFFVHIDGKFRHLVELLKKTGVTGIESISIPDMGGDLELKEARELLQEMIMIPNFPSNLAFRDEAEIAAYLKKLKEENEGYPLMLQVSEDIPQHSWQRILPIMCSEFGKK